jgi:hypothetical protein
MYFCTFWYIIQKCRVPMIPCPCRCHARTKLPPMCHVPLPLPWACPDQTVAVLCTFPSRAVHARQQHTRAQIFLGCDASGDGGSCIVPPFHLLLMVVPSCEFAWSLINSFIHQIITIKKLRKDNRMPTVNHN